MGRFGGHGTWPRRAGLRQANALATDSSEAGSGQGGSRWLQWCDGNAEAMARAGVLSSHACPEQRGREALQQRPRGGWRWRPTTRRGGARRSTWQLTMVSPVCRYVLGPSITAAAVTQWRQWQRVQATRGSGAAVGAASSNRCLGQRYEERQLDALGWRLASWCTAEVTPVMRAWPGQGRGLGEEAVRG
jgi:hypothetical protein